MGWQARSGSRGWLLSVSEHEPSKTGARLVMVGPARTVFAFADAVAAARGEVGLPDDVDPEELEAAYPEAKRLMAKSYAAERARAEEPEVRARKARSAAKLRKSAFKSLGVEGRISTIVPLTGTNVAPEDAKGPIALGLADVRHGAEESLQGPPASFVYNYQPAPVVVPQPEEEDFTRQLDPRPVALTTDPGVEGVRARLWYPFANGYAQRRSRAEGYQNRDEDHMAIAP
jgi:hypothetical protein